MNVNLKEKIKVINDELKDHEYKLSLVKEKIDMPEEVYAWHWKEE